MITGRLEYLGWSQPTWTIFGEPGSGFNLRTYFWEFAQSHKGKAVRHEYGRDHYKLIADPAAECDLLFETVGAGIIITKSLRGGFGFSNVSAYLEHSLMALNARRVIVEIDQSAFSIKADPGEEVFGVYYTDRGNSARVPAGAEDSVCRVGTADACIFATYGKAGFRCEKFDAPTARHLLDRKANGSMRASRIGNCRILGREQCS